MQKMKSYQLKVFITRGTDFERVQAVLKEVLEIPEVEKVQIFDATATTEQLHLHKLFKSDEEAKANGFA